MVDSERVDAVEGATIDGVGVGVDATVASHSPDDRTAAEQAVSLCKDGLNDNKARPTDAPDRRTPADWDTTDSFQLTRNAHTTLRRTRLFGAAQADNQSATLPLNVNAKQSTVAAVVAVVVVCDTLPVGVGVLCDGVGVDDDDDIVEVEGNGMQHLTRAVRLRRSATATVDHEP